MNLTVYQRLSLWQYGSMIPWQQISHFAACLLLTSFLRAQQETPVYFSVPPVDAPELAPRGSYSVGVRTLDLVNPGQVDILRFEPSNGRAPLYDRPLKVEVWYPAVIPPGQREHTEYESATAGRFNAPGTFRIAGKAMRDAPPVTDRKFPLVVVSHGYPGSRTFLSYLTENLASKGYVVAAIDHTDSVFGAVKGFASTLLNRSQDQLFTIEQLADMAFLRSTLDATKVAIIGYSMGGFGALASVGADYSPQSAPARQLVPGEYLRNLHLKRNPNVKAVVAIAPWGAQPPMNSWDAAGLAGIHVPSLFIVGDQDDISGYQQGVKRAFDGAVNSERYLLVFENARHNVGGNPAPPGMPLDFTGRESFEEPVWRKERITAINQHFVTAFLDLYLKGDASRGAYLHPVPERSNDGEWPLKQGETVGAEFSPGKGYWKGFQRRWAVGLQMHSASAQGTSTARVPKAEWTSSAVRITNVADQPIAAILVGQLYEIEHGWASQVVTWNRRTTNPAGGGLAKGESQEMKLEPKSEAPARRLVGVMYANGEMAGDPEAMESLAGIQHAIAAELPDLIRQFQAVADGGASQAEAAQWVKNWKKDDGQGMTPPDPTERKARLPQDYARYATPQIRRHLSQFLASSTPAEALADLKQWLANR